MVFIVVYKSPVAMAQCCSEEDLQGFVADCVIINEFAIYFRIM